jgi:coproporphyrinogen III oxidase-like Fe-S oxidoreductase
LFKHLKFRVIPLEEVEADIQRVHEAGGNPRKIFLGDGSAFALPTEHLMKILALIHQYFQGSIEINMNATLNAPAT